MKYALALAAVLAGCGGGRAIDATRAAALFERVTVETGGVHGLSGLAVDGDGALWTVAERGKTLFRIELDGAAVRAVTRHPVDIGDGNDLESLAWADGTLWAGLETRGAALLHVVALRRDGDRFGAEQIATVTAAEAGVRLRDNHGVEGLCAAGGVLVAAVEAAGSDARGRWAPLVVIDRADPSRRTVHRLRLTSATGKLSGLDCRQDLAGAAGTLEVLAIERHFEITRLVAFTLDPAASAPPDITPRIALDLGPALRGALNLEGIVFGPDDRPIAVVDNQYGRITGPNELLRFSDPLPVP